MEIIIAVAIGALTGSGLWLLLRPRTFQVIIGLSLLSYATNLFIFSMGRLRSATCLPILPNPIIPMVLPYTSEAKMRGQ